MNRLKKTIPVLLITLLCIATLPMTAFAADHASGVTASIATDKASYAKHDTVLATATVTNTNQFDVKNIKLELLLPEGLHLKSGEADKTGVTLAAGQTLTINLGAALQNNLKILLWLLLCGIPAVLLIGILAFKKKRTDKALSLLLCLAIIFSAWAPAISVLAEDSVPQTEISYDKTVTVGGTPYTLAAKATFDTLVGFAAPAPVTINGVTAAVTFDKTSPQTAGTVIKATISLSGTAKKDGDFTFDLTSEKAGLTTNAKTKTVTAGATTGTYDFTFTVLEQNVTDFVLTFKSPYPVPRGEPGTYSQSNFFDLIEDGVQKYQLHQPARKETGVKYPVLIHLHGAGEQHNTLVYPRELLTGSILIDDLMNKINHNPDYYESYVVLPIEYNIKNIKLMIDRLINEEAADPNRIYITGVSMGGFGTCDFMFAYPDVPACAVPICGSTYNSYNASDILNIPIRIYHSDDDNVVSVSTSRNLYHNLVQLGSKKVEYYECTGYQHYCWEYAHRTDMLDWMYLQNKEN